MELIELKIICPTCKGDGTIFWNPNERRMCQRCYGGGLISPPKQILDDLECVEIEREISKTFRISIEYAKSEVEVWVHDKRTWDYIFSTEGKTKLEALRKAKEWLENK